MKRFFQTNMGKIAVETFIDQFREIAIGLVVLWSLQFFIPIFRIRVLLENIEYENQWNFMSISQAAAQVYMLVVGIVFASIVLAFYVRRGVTRKDSFFGMTLGTFAMMIFVPLLIMMLTGVDYVLANIFQVSSITDGTISLGSYTNVFSVIIVYIMTVFTYFLIGWLIGIGFYRFGWIIGLAFIPLAILFASLVDFLWFDYASLFTLEVLSNIRFLSSLAEALINILSNMGDMVFFLSLVGNILLLGILLWVIHLITKNVVIRVK